jgi:23S rRNA pseudouridine2605 synthase
MRLNQFIASTSSLSRRRADEAILANRVRVNGHIAVVGEQIETTDHVELDGVALMTRPYTYLAFNKPVGVVCSRRQQGSDKTIYQLLPQAYQHLNTVGRLDKDSCGLIVLTNDGSFTERVSHPRYEKQKKYFVKLDRYLFKEDQTKLEAGVMLDDGKSTLEVSGERKEYTVGLHEGRNRQVRRSFEALGYQVRFLQRVQFGKLALGNLKEGRCRTVEPTEII